MSLPTSDELRAITVQAIAEGQVLVRQKLAQIQEAKERKAKAHQLFAERVLSKVPAKCRAEAAEGRDHAVVLGLKQGRDYVGYPSTNQLDPSVLQGPGAIVRDELVKAGLETTIEYWYSGDGMDSGYNLVIKWPNEGAMSDYSSTIKIDDV